MDVQGFRLGKHAYQHDDRTLRLSAYANVQVLPTPPPKVDDSTKVSTWPMYGNDRLGDCTCAAAGHMLELWTALSGTPVQPSDQQVIDMYWAITGHQDTGAQELSVLKYWRKHGLDHHSIGAFVLVDQRNRANVELTMSLFGGVYIGLMLPSALDPRNTATWDVPPTGATGAWAPDPRDGHAVNIVGYDPSGLTAITWGRVQKMTWTFWDAYCDEAWAILSADVLAHPPAGFDAAALQKDIVQVGQTPPATPAGAAPGS